MSAPAYQKIFFPLSLTLCIMQALKHSAPKNRNESSTAFGPFRSRLQNASRQSAGGICPEPGSCLLPILLGGRWSLRASDLHGRRLACGATTRRGSQAATTAASVRHVEGPHSMAAPDSLPSRSATSIPSREETTLSVWHTAALASALA